MGHESLTSPPINHSRRLGRPLLTVHRLLWLPQHTRVPLRSPRFHPRGNCHPDPLLLPAEQVPLPPARAARVAGRPRDGSQARGHGNAAHAAVVSRERVRGQRSVRWSEGAWVWRSSMGRIGRMKGRKVHAVPRGPDGLKPFRIFACCKAMPPRVYDMERLYLWKQNRAMVQHMEE